MANPNRITWNGPVASRYIEGIVARRVKKAAMILAEETQKECPVDSGALKGTIRVEKGEGRLDYSVAVGDEAAGVDYAKHVHDGTSRQEANPFLTRAIANGRAAMKATLAGQGESALGRIGGAIAEGIGRLFGR